MYIFLIGVKGVMEYLINYILLGVGVITFIAGIVSIIIGFKESNLTI